MLAPGGKLRSVPFIYPIHDARDYRRLTPTGIAQLFPAWAIEKVTMFGGLGLTVVLMLNTWVDNVLCFTLARRLTKGLIFPLRLPLHAVFNATALLVDAIDGTERYFHNSLVVLGKAGT